MDLENNYTLYMHISPSNKRYVGITSKEPEERWGTNGSGYCYNKHFTNAINKYGWNNFEHRILNSNLSREEACNLEKILIELCKSYMSEFGYNQDMGGICGKHSPETKEKLRNLSLARWQNKDYRNIQIIKHKNQKITEETKRKISESLKGRISPRKGVKLTEEQKSKLRGRTPWNKGLTKKTNKSLSNTSKKLSGRVFKDETRKKMSISRIENFENGYCPQWINNGKIETTIDLSKGESVPKGFIVGRLDTIYIHKDEETKKIHPEDLDMYLEKGWERGKSEKINKAIQKSNQQYIWMYEGLQFHNSNELASYLNSHGYESIVSSTITSLYNKGFDTSKKYRNLDGKITRIEIR